MKVNFLVKNALCFAQLNLMKEKKDVDVYDFFFSGLSQKYGVSPALLKNPTRNSESHKFFKSYGEDYLNFLMKSSLFNDHFRDYIRNHLKKDYSLKVYSLLKHSRRLIREKILRQGTKDSFSEVL